MLIKLASFLRQKILNIFESGIIDNSISCVLNFVHGQSNKKVVVFLLKCNSNSFNHCVSLNFLFFNVFLNLSMPGLFFALFCGTLVCFLVRSKAGEG